MFDAGRAALVVDGICVVTKGFSAQESQQKTKSGLKSVTLISDPNPVSQVLW
jgi:hypothetical protein